MQKFETILQPLLWFWIAAVRFCAGYVRLPAQDISRGKIHKIVATFVYASSQGQLTHSARTKIKSDVLQNIYCLWLNTELQYLKPISTLCLPDNRIFIMVRYKTFPQSTRNPLPKKTRYHGRPPSSGIIQPFLDKVGLHVSIKPIRVFSLQILHLKF